MPELNDILQRLEPSLGPLEGQPVPLQGGITNRNFRVKLGGREYVVRLHGHASELLGIDRETERRANEGAAALGIAPAVAAALEGCLVTQFVDCRALEQHEIRSNVERVARALRAFHERGPRLRARFAVPELLERYASLLRARGVQLPAPYAHAQNLAARVAAALPGEQLRPCHNDLLAANILRVGEERLLIVDWEYAGMGSPYFDLGNLSVNNGFDDEDDARLLDAYHDEPPGAGRVALLKLMRVLSDAREAAWGVLQGHISELDFDFAAYAARHFERLREAGEAPQLEEWLASVAA